MSRYLHTLSAALFYIAGGSFFGAYVLLHNGIGGQWPLFWLNVGDLPLLCLGLIYGGLSVYHSLTDGQHSHKLALGIGIPLVALFVLGLIANFWPAL